MDVTLPDGTVIQGVPDGMSKADLTLKLKNNGYDVSKLEPVATTGKNRVRQQMGEVMKPALDYTGQDATGGFLRGAGSIGTTIMRMLPNALGGDTEQENAARRANLDPSIAQFTGANPESTAYKTNKLGAEIAGTAAFGGLLGKAAQAAGAAPKVVSALTSSGMTTGAKVAPGAGNMLADLALRSGASAVTGAASAGAIDPADAKTGLAIGGAVPVVTKVMGAGGDALGKVLRGPEQTPEMLAAIKAARDAGYVIPPTQAKPSLGNRLLEGFSGKITTAQNASAKNAGVTDSLAAKAIGLAPETKITPDVLNDVRKTAAQAYEAVAALPVKPAQQASSVSNTPFIPEVNPRSMVFDLRKARNDATAWYNSYARTADPDALVKAKAFRSEASSLEKALEDYAASVGRSDLVPAMVDARTLIAKTHTIEKALNPTSGTVDARKLGSMLDKGKPLTGELKTAGDFANRFPKAAQTVEKMGSLPQNSPLDWTAAGALGMATQNPLALGAVMLRPGARALSLSGPVQNRLAMQQSQNKLAALLASPEAQQLLYRAAPVASGQ